VAKNACPSDKESAEQTAEVRAAGLRAEQLAAAIMICRCALAFCPPISSQANAANLFLDCNDGFRLVQRRRSAETSR